jgi:hypothetical protein
VLAIAIVAMLGQVAWAPARSEPRLVDSTAADSGFDLNDEVLAVCWRVYAMRDPQDVAAARATQQERVRRLSEGLAASLRASDETRRQVARHHADLGAARLDEAFATAGTGATRAARAAEQARGRAILQSVQAELDRIRAVGADVVGDGRYQGLRADQLAGLRDRATAQLDAIARGDTDGQDRAAREAAAREALRATLRILAVQEETERRLRARLAVAQAVAKGVDMCIERQLTDMRAGRVAPPPTSGAPPGRLVGRWRASCPRPGYEAPRYGGRFEFDIAPDGRLTGSFDGDWDYGSLLGTSETSGAVEGQGVGKATFLFSGTVRSAGGRLHGSGSLLRSDGGDKCPGTWQSP